MFPRGGQDGFIRHHHAQVDDLKAIAAEHDADDILADVVYVAVSCCQHHPRAVCGLCAALGIDGGLQQRHGFLHHLGRLHHLRQEHLAFAEELPDVLHGLHERLLDDGDGPPVFL